MEPTTLRIESESLENPITLDALCQDGLNIVQASDLEVLPDRDLIVLRDDAAETYFAVNLPSYAKLDGLRNGDAVKISFANDPERPARSGKILRFADNTCARELEFAGAFLAHRGVTGEGTKSVLLDVGGKTFPALLSSCDGLAASDTTDDMDHLIVTAADGKFFDLALPYYFPEELAPQGAEFTIATPEGELLQGTSARFEPADGAWIKTLVTLAGESHPGLIREIENPEAALLHAEPFTDDVIVEKDGRYYQITLSSEFSGVTAGDEIKIGYVAYSFSGASENDAGFTATVHSFVDVEKKQKYVLADALDVKVHTPIGDDIPEDSKTDDVLDEFAARKTGLKIGKSYKQAVIERRMKRLHRQLSKSALSSDSELSWAAQDESLHFSVDVTLPAYEHDLELAMAQNVSPEWLMQNVSVDDQGEIKKQIEAVLAKRSPVTAASMKVLVKDLKRLSAKNHPWEVDDMSMVIGEDNRANFTVTLSPKATGFAIVVDGQNVTTDLKLDLPERITPARLGACGKNHFIALSEHFAEQGQILAVARDGKLVPYVPEYRKRNDQWEYVATAEGTANALPIVTAPAPTFLIFEDATDAHGKSIGPSEFERSEMFRECGKLTTFSIDRGLQKLTRWYQDNGFPLVGEKLAVELTPAGELKIKADVYQLASDVIFITDPADGYEEKRVKHMKFVKREFRMSAGDALNYHDLSDAISSVDYRFHYQAVPFVETDPVTKTATLTIQLVRKTGSGWESLTLAGGYGTQGLIFQAGEAATTHTGHKIATNLSVYPMSDFASLATTLSTPREESGAQNEFAFSAKYYLDFISSLEASYRRKIPIGDSDFSFIAGGGIEALFSTHDIAGANALYFKPDLGIAYSKRGFTAQIVGGPRVNSLGHIFGGLEASVHKRFDLTEDKSLYAEAYARAGLLFGNVPDAALYHTQPVALHGAYVQTPAMIQLYAVVGVALMQELPGGFLDVGIDASAGIIGATFAIGGGVRIKLKVFFPLTFTIGPALVNGVPTIVTVSFG